MPRTGSDQAAPKKRQPNATSFKPGQSGNPKGRPKLPDDVKDAFKAMHSRALQRLSDLIDSEDEKVALHAAEVAIERNQGRVPQKLEVDANVRMTGKIDPKKLTDAQLKQAKAIQRAAGVAVAGGD